MHRPPTPSKTVFQILEWTRTGSNKEAKAWIICLSVVFGPMPLQWISRPRLQSRTQCFFGLLARSILASVKEGKTWHDQLGIVPYFPSLAWNINRN
ncbi:hypothetical protein BVC80_1751g170 [Macleaya cordata]|uniref:Uncharacterized protein n=1 Tax=Macleaya cordata TaxID=56857 RepID=A0A200QHL7_MACCD|nr:hypothetical protein BVC80_1751g170 [Macleaya cordata]